LEEGAEAIGRHLTERGIATGRHYPFLCPDQPAARGIGVTHGQLTVARRLAARELSLPIHPYLHDDELDLVIEACLELCP
jgi:UDP-2-acetamido-2-deoxy-ribo-hexuluronate aminotransferase